MLTLVCLTASSYKQLNLGSILKIKLDTYDKSRLVAVSTVKMDTLKRGQRPCS